MKKKRVALPSKIKVKITRGKSGAWIADLPEYNIHTESDSLSGLDFLINDLIYAYFDVPKKHWGKIWYKPQAAEVEPKINLRKLLLYQQYVASNAVHLIK